MGELGSLLTRAREARGLTLEDAERDTRISRRYLQALEAEQFEVIPAPVYARGFLRSYSQYLGIDPQEALAMFPREDDPEYQRAAEVNAPPPRATRDSPVSPVSAARPSWRRAPAQASPAPVSRQQGAFPEPDDQEPVVEAPRRPTPLGRPRPQPAPSTREQDWEPVIGIDIGLPSPANRIKTDPAAQTRSVVVAIVALAVILGVVALAVIISNLGGSDEPPPGTSPDSTQTGGDGLAALSSTETPSASGDVTPGIVPQLVGLQEAEAKQMITAAGFQVRELRTANSAQKGTVIDQSPAAEVEQPRGRQVVIVISEGQ
jgi:cytoskeletal protein RodZ